MRAGMNPDEAVLLWVDEYTRMAEAYEANVVPRFAPFAARLVEQASLARNATVLDVSTGTGLTAMLAATALGGTGLVVAMDLADGALALAQTKAARAGLRNLRFEMLDSRNIVYRGGAFDRVLTSFGLPAIGHGQVLQEIFRVLKEGGTFHMLGWGPRTREAGWDAWEAILAAHRTGTPSKALAQVRAASELRAASGDYAAIRDPPAVTAKMEATGFSRVHAEPVVETVEFATLDDLIAYHASFGPTERELAEMGEAGRAAFRSDLEARFAEYRHDDAIRLRWFLVYYAAAR